MELLNKLKETTRFLQEKGMTSPEVGLVLGTGLGQLVDEIEVEQSIPYSQIPNFPLATVEFHEGQLIYGQLKGKKILAMKGRFHHYEGYAMNEVTFPIRVMKLLGISFLLLSNAAGAVNLDFEKGGVVVIEDHINLLPINPLRGENPTELGPRFPDMSEAYNKQLNQLFFEIAEKQKIELKSGVYVAVSGPNLETKAEYRMLKRIGADMVGMSTVPEVIVANHMDLPCAAISVITDLCDPDHLEPIDVQDIIKTAKEAEKKLIVLFKELVGQLDHQLV